jgi:Pyridoxamine 5'-phosphate oxidase
MIWGDFEAAAAEIARPGRERLEVSRIAMLGTLRRDGSPRISPVEPYFVGGHLLFGAMAWSKKSADLRRDPRCVVHSTVTGPDAGEPELKLYGRAVEVDNPELRDAHSVGWWVGRPGAEADVFSLDVERAVLIVWDVEGGELTSTRWSESGGLVSGSRPYP